MSDTLTKTDSKTNETPVQTNGRSNPISYLRPLANVVETPDGYVLEAEMPGVSKSGLEITVEDGELLIVGRRSGGDARGQQIYRESRLADFRRAFELDPSIDAGKITAKLDNGLLQVNLPKSESVKPRKIELVD